MGTLHGAFGKQDAIVRDDAARQAVDMREAANQRRAIAGFELVKARAIDRARYDFTDVIGRLKVCRNDAQNFRRIIGRVFGGQPLDRRAAGRTKVADNLSREGKRMRVVFSEMIGNTRQPRVRIAAAEVFGGDFFARRHFHERRTSQEDRALLAHNDRLV